MKALYIDRNIHYDGSQLSPLFAYLNFQILGNSIIAFQGSCDIVLEHMADGEDLLAQAKIQSHKMIHFIIEVFNEDLTTGVFIQRLFASIIQNEIYKETNTLLLRKGDDLYFEDKKLSISVATKSSASILVHFAMNLTNDGTPVKTLSLADLKINPLDFSKKLLILFKEEFEDIKNATYKVRPV